MILPSILCSITCAAQPAVRAIANTGVNIAVGIPSIRKAGALYQSRFGNILFSPHITFSMRSQTSNRPGAPPSAHRPRAISLMIGLRGSAIVYTGWPKPMMISPEATRARMSDSAAAASLYRRAISIATSLAPPCLGPRRAPIAPQIAECRSEPVPAITRAAKVEALNSCSAYRMSPRSRARTQCREGRGIEFVLRVQDEPAVQSANVGGGRRPAMEQPEEVAGERGLVRRGLDPPPAVGVMVPVKEHRGERGDQAVRDGPRLRGPVRGLLRVGRPEGRAARSKDVHRMGSRRDQLERGAHNRGQTPAPGKARPAGE